jgi:hypothetical protein
MYLCHEIALHSPMSAITPAVQAIVGGISEFLGPPTGETMYVVAWSCGEFEVAVQQDTGPHIWISQRWRPKGQVFSGLTIEQYPPGKSRISNLEANTPTLGTRYAARRLSFVGSQVGAAVRCVRACAVDAGVIEDATAGSA